MPGVVDKGLYVVRYVHREALDREKVVGVSGEERCNSEGDCLGGPYAPFKELEFLGEIEVVHEKGGWKLSGLIGFGAGGRGRYTNALGTGYFSNRKEDSFIYLVVKLWVACHVSERDGEEFLA